MKTKFKIIIIQLFVFFVIKNQVFAYSDNRFILSNVAELKSATGLNVNAAPFMTLYDPDVYDMNGNLNTSCSNGEIFKRGQRIVFTLLTNPDLAVAEAPMNPYSVDLRLWVQYKIVGGTNLSSRYIDLKINYDPSFGASYKAKDQYILENVDFSTIRVDYCTIKNKNNIEITNITPSMHNWFQLYAELQTETFVKPNIMNPLQTFNSSNNVFNFSSSNGYLDIEWNDIETLENSCMKSWAEYFELEYTFVDDYSGDEILKYDFKHNSTRVQVPNIASRNENTRIKYSIPLVFESGYLVFRVRAVGLWGTKFDQPIYGRWSGATELLQFNSNVDVDMDMDNEGKGEFQVGSIPNSYIYDVVPHENDKKNWQCITTFAEEAKQKTVVSYYDGTSRNRQTQTNLSTDKNIVVAENIYDAFGREAINFLPTPLYNNTIGSNNETVTEAPHLGYRNNFNVNAAGHGYSYLDFDLEGSDDVCLFAPSIAGTSSGASQYYSPQNQFINAPLTPNNMSCYYIPDAKQYPFSQKEYLADPRGLVKRVGMPGESHHLGNGDGTTHEQKFMYSSPAQEELDLIFGNDVGYAVFYSKEVVFDANGQASITYKDNKNHVVATALAGETNSDLLDALPSQGEFFPITREYISGDPNTEVNYQNGTIMITDVIDLVTPSNINLTYNIEDINADFNLCENHKFCFDCKYDLDIKIVNNDCNELIYDLDDPNGDEYFHIGNAPSLMTGVCNDLPNIYDDNNHDNGLSIHEVIGDNSGAPLPKGTYVVTKILKVNEQAVQQAVDVAVNNILDEIKNNPDSQCNVFRTEDVIEANCSLDCSDLPRIEGGGIQNPVIFDAESGSACAQPSFENEPCDLAYYTMYIQMLPGGTYGSEDQSNGFSIYNEQNMLVENWSNIDFKYLKRNGSTYVLSDVLIDIQEAELEVDRDYNNTATITDGKIKLSDIINRQKLINILRENPAYGYSLVQYHPEYCYYEFCANEAALANITNETITAKDILRFYNKLEQFQYSEDPTVDVVNDFVDKMDNTNLTEVTLQSENIFDDLFLADPLVKALSTLTNATNDPNSLYNLFKRDLEKFDLATSICPPTNNSTHYDIMDMAIISTSTSVDNNVLINRRNNFLTNSNIKKLELVNYVDNYLQIHFNYFDIYREQVIEGNNNQESQCRERHRNMLLNDPWRNIDPVFPSPRQLQLTATRGSNDNNEVDATVITNICNIETTASSPDAPLGCDNDGTCSRSFPFFSFLNLTLNKNATSPLVLRDVSLFSMMSFLSDPERNILVEAIYNGSEVTWNPSFISPNTFVYSVKIDGATPPLFEIKLTPVTTIDRENFNALSPDILPDFLTGNNNTAVNTETMKELLALYCLKSRGENPNNFSVKGIFAHKLPDDNNPYTVDLQELDILFHGEVSHVNIGGCAISNGSGELVASNTVAYSASASVYSEVISNLGTNEWSPCIEFNNGTSYQYNQKLVKAYSKILHNYLFYETSEYIDGSGIDPDIQYLLDIPLLGNPNRIELEISTVPYVIAGITYQGVSEIFVKLLYPNNTTATDFFTYVLEHKYPTNIDYNNNAAWQEQTSFLIDVPQSGTCNGKLRSISKNFSDVGPVRAFLQVTDSSLDDLFFGVNPLGYFLRCCPSPPPPPNPPFCCTRPTVAALEEEDLCATATQNIDNTNTSISLAHTIEYYSNLVATAYRRKCVLNALGHETLKLSYEQLYHHYTLYYYDQAGNLFATVPPVGVHKVKLTEASAEHPTETLGQQIQKARMHVAGYAPIYLLPNFDENAAPVDPESSNASITPPPLHKMVTTYFSNSLNAVTVNHTPDGGSTHFTYDELGRIIKSQNDLQKDDHNFSFSHYDALGRLTLSGIYHNQDELQVAKPFEKYSESGIGTLQEIQGLYQSENLGEVTLTAYDNVIDNAYVNALGFQNLDFTLNDQFSDAGQRNLYNRVAASYFAKAPKQLGYGHAYFYSYDIHGNVRELLQDHRVIARYLPTSNVLLPTILNEIRLKKLDYNYDLISGKVNTFTYQPRKPDQFIHYYKYDADNRLTEVYTAQHPWEHLNVREADAKYYYYKHGPLSRIELGREQVQGIDYYYNILGWLKGVNSSTLNPLRDPGRDGIANDNGIGFHKNFAGDAMGFSIGYHQNDYTPIQASNISDQQQRIQFLPYIQVDGLDSNAPGSPLYNGNISHLQSTQIAFSDNPLLSRFFRYDALNRIKISQSNTSEYAPHMDAPLPRPNEGQSIFERNNIEDLNLSENYKESFDYDGNGNILGLLRNDHNGNNMDSLSYGYNSGITNIVGNNANIDPADYNPEPQNNQLTEVRDKALLYGKFGRTNPDNVNDIDRNSRFRYDAKGRLVESNEYFTNEDNPNMSRRDYQVINWTSTDKIDKVIREVQDGTTSPQTTKMDFEYNALGQRIVKAINILSGKGNFTYYVRDIQGNPLAIYTYDQNNKTLRLMEVPMYGSSRLGMFRPEQKLWNAQTEINPSNVEDVPLLRVASDSSTATEQPWFKIYDATMQPSRVYKYEYKRGKKQYELNNHLGNVMSTVTDRKVHPLLFKYALLNKYPGQASNFAQLNMSSWYPSLYSANEYYAFGSPMPMKQFTPMICAQTSNPVQVFTEVYKYSFNNGHESGPWKKATAAAGEDMGKLEVLVDDKQLKVAYTKAEIDSTTADLYYENMANISPPSSIGTLYSLGDLSAGGSYRLNFSLMLASSKTSAFKTETMKGAKAASAGADKDYYEAQSMANAEDNKKTQAAAAKTTAAAQLSEAEAAATAAAGTAAAAAKEMEVEMAESTLAAKETEYATAAERYTMAKATADSLGTVAEVIMDKTLALESKVDKALEQGVETYLEVQLLKNGSIADSLLLAQSGSIAQVSFDFDYAMGDDYSVRLLRRLTHTPLALKDTLGDKLYDAYISSMLTPFSIDEVRLMERKTLYQVSTKCGDDKTFYRFGFNGKEQDPEFKGKHNVQDYGFRMNDTRYGRFFSVDPLRAKYPMLSTYQFASNSPIMGIDLDGLELMNFETSMYSMGYGKE
jgi:RHS repeat-associated protein